MKKLLLKLARRLALLEGKKSEARMGDIMEIMALVKKQTKKDPEFVNDLLKYLVG